MKSYILTIERASDRREQVQTEFQHYDIEFEFFWGIDWRDFSEQDIIENVHPKYLRKSKKFYIPSVHGMLACWLSHRNIWKAALANGEQVIAIFEDDATLTPETKPALNALENWEGEFDIVFIYNGKPHRPLFPIHSIDKKFKLNLVKYEGLGAVGYVISSKGMTTLLEQFPQMVINIDALMHWYWWSGLKTYILTPQVVFHGEPDREHHSFNQETFTDEFLAQLGRKRTSKVEREIRQFFNKLFSKYIPQRVAFRERLKTESTQNARNSSQP